MDDRSILAHICDLVAEEKALRARQVGTGLNELDQTRLQGLEEDLDQCWDLLRQRRAKEEFGGNPDTVRTRPATDVESYLQ
jgi:hypothetical protein